MVPTELVAGAQEAVPLGPDRTVTVQIAGEQQRVQVALTRTEYRAAVTYPVGAEEKRWSGKLYLYEVTSTDPNTPFVWAFWTGSTEWPVFLCADPQGGVSYFGWSTSVNVSFTPLSGPRDSAAGLDAGFLGLDAEAFVRVPVVEVLGRLPFLPGDGDAPKPGEILDATKSGEIIVRSITEDSPGRWVVVVTGSSSADMFTLVSDGDQWRRQ